MLVSESSEEILEALWIVYEEKSNNCIKLSELRQMPDMKDLKELLDAGILERRESDEVRLTPVGVRSASDAVRRHRLAERLLVDVLSVKKDQIHDTACQFEHHLHKGIDINVCTLLGHPKFCPHGKKIPSGKCCEEGVKLVSQAVSPLANLKHGQGGQIAYLSTTNPKQAQMLLSMGVIPGARIKLLAGFPSFLFQLGEGQFAVDSDIAREVYVRVEG